MAHGTESARRSYRWLRAQRTIAVTALNTLIIAAGTAVLFALCAYMAVALLQPHRLKGATPMQVARFGVSRAGLGLCALALLLTTFFRASRPRIRCAGGLCMVSALLLPLMGADMHWRGRLASHNSRVVLLVYALVELWTCVCVYVANRKFARSQSALTSTAHPSIV